jgi:hypothetical protein
MSHRTVVPSTFEEYLASDDDSLEERAAQEANRNGRLSRFPYSVMLKVSFPELDFANRWCWQTFGPSDGECTQRFSEYRVCDRTEPHSHVGKWTAGWLWVAEGEPRPAPRVNSARWRRETPARLRRATLRRSGSGDA